MPASVKSAWRPGPAPWQRRDGASAITICLTTAWLAAAAIAALCTTVAAAPPSRIVSLNLCTDQILLDLVPRERIRALSHLAADPAVSAVSAQAAGIPTTRGEAEIVLAHDPDLVLAGEWSTPATVSLLARVGRRVLRVPLASDLDGIRAAIRQVAAALDETAAGERVIGAMDRRLTAVDRDPGSSPCSGDSAAGRPAVAAPACPDRPAPVAPTALVYQVNGLASGSGSLADTLLRAAGLANHARRLGLGAGGTLPLERLVADPPDLVVLTGPIDEYRTAVADNLRHPALTAVRRQRASVIVPWRYWLCGTRHVATAVELLAATRRGLPPSPAAPAGQGPR